MQNDWKAIRSFFNWASKEFKLKTRPDANLKLPRYMAEEIIPFTQEDVEALLQAAEYTKEANPGNRKSFRMKRATATRDISILLILLDTGLRVGELSRLQKRDINLDTGEIVVKPFGSGTKSRARTVYLGKSGRRALWKFIAGNELDPGELVFQMETNSIRWLLRRLGDRAGVKDVHPHRFRHTFGRPFGRLVIALLNATRYQERVFSPWRFRAPSDSGLVSFQGKGASCARETDPQKANVRK